MLVNQFSVFLENRVGQLAELTGLLRENEINLEALNIAETSDYGIVRFITSDEARTEAALKEKNYIYSVSPMVISLVENRPGGLDDVLKLIASSGISIEYMYSIFISVGNNACMAFRVDDPEGLIAVLKENGLEPDLPF